MYAVSLVVGRVNSFNLIAKPQTQVDINEHALHEKTLPAHISTSDCPDARDRGSRNLVESRAAQALAAATPVAADRAASRCSLGPAQPHARLGPPASGCAAGAVQLPPVPGGQPVGTH